MPWTGVLRDSRRVITEDRRFYQEGADFWWGDSVWANEAMGIKTNPVQDLLCQWGISVYNAGNVLIGEKVVGERLVDGYGYQTTTYDFPGDVTSILKIQVWVKIGGVRYNYYTFVPKVAMRLQKWLSTQWFVQLYTQRLVNAYGTNAYFKWNTSYLDSYIGQVKRQMIQIKGVLTEK